MASLSYSLPSHRNTSIIAQYLDGKNVCFVGK